MTSKQLDQHQKSRIVRKAADMGFKEAAKITGVHYTPVYEWQRQVKALEEEGFVNYQARRPRRGRKEITEEQEKAILATWQANRGYGPGQMCNQLRRQGKTLSIRMVRRVIQANGYDWMRRKGKCTMRAGALRRAVPWSWRRWTIFHGSSWGFVFWRKAPWARCSGWWWNSTTTAVPIRAESFTLRTLASVVELYFGTLASWVRGLEEVRQYLDAHDMANVSAAPANPKRNGTDEGAFSQLKRTIGTVQLDASSPQAWPSAFSRWLCM